MIPSANPINSVHGISNTKNEQKRLENERIETIAQNTLANIPFQRMMRRINNPGEKWISIELIDHDRSYYYHEKDRVKAILEIFRENGFDVRLRKKNFGTSLPDWRYCIEIRNQEVPDRKCIIL